MKQISLALAIPFFLFACKKSVTPAIDLTSFLQPGPTNSAEIRDSWTLIGSRHYGVPAITDTAWKPQDTIQGKVVVDFRSDSIFSYNNNYVWRAQGFNRYSYLDTAFYAVHPAFRIYASQLPAGNIAYPPTFARLVNHNSLIITYMGIDTDDQELYTSATYSGH